MCPVVVPSSERETQKSGGAEGKKNVYEGVAGRSGLFSGVMKKEFWRHTWKF